MSENWDWIRRSLETAKLLNARGRLSRDTLLSEFQSLQKNVCLILNIAEQNAGLLIYRYVSSSHNNNLRQNSTY